jgi:peptidyl-prolyl cis-trans isomerase D
VVVFKAADFKDPAKLSQQQIADFYKKNKSNYVVPERVKLSYVRLSPDVLTATVNVSDDELRDFYEQNRDQFVAPEERKMRHILLMANPDNEAQQLAAAEKLVSELNAGGDFAALAKKYSEDPGSADLGGDLGWVSRGVMVPEFEDAGFALNKNVISEPVKS